MRDAWASNIVSIADGQGRAAHPPGQRLAASVQRPRRANSREKMVIRSVRLSKLATSRTPIAIEIYASPS
jgi:hypothetical protein